MTTLTVDWPQCPHCHAQVDDLSALEGHGTGFVTMQCTACCQSFEVRQTTDALMQVRASTVFPKPLKASAA